MWLIGATLFIGGAIWFVSQFGKVFKSAHELPTLPDCGNHVSPPLVDKWVPKLRQEDYLNLQIQEYNALRAEQRTRLDAANRLIHYNVLVIGFVIAGLLASYKHDNIQEFRNAFQTALLMLPLLSMPFTFTQWNDEIIVDNIGRHIEKMANVVVSDLGVKYWEWEQEHNKAKPFVLLVTAMVRSGFFTLFSLASLVTYQLFFHSGGLLTLPGGNQAVDKVRRILFVADLGLITLAIVTLIGIGWRKRQRGKLYVGLSSEIAQPNGSDI